MWDLESYLKVYLKGVCLVMSAIYRLIPSVKFCREKAIILVSGNSKGGWLQQKEVDCRREGSQAALALQRCLNAGSRLEKKPRGLAEDYLRGSAEVQGIATGAAGASDFIPT